MPQPPVAKRRLRFTLRDALAATLIIALALGWYASHRQAQRQYAELVRRLNYDAAEADYGKSREETFNEAKQRRHTEPYRTLFAVDFSGSNLKGVSITGPDIAFQLAIFNNANLADARLAGSFQGAQFKNANLAGARLTGGGASFQESSFEGANLIGATLIGGGSSFQASTFQRANLRGARIICSGTSFQAVNIDAANFQAADLSTIDPGALTSCHFKTAPTYDDQTRFPAGFDPQEQGWERVPTTPGKEESSR
jgi:uncharacterized protein YjbI with pentapeptide repeats